MGLTHCDGSTHRRRRARHPRRVRGRPRPHRRGSDRGRVRATPTRGTNHVSIDVTTHGTQQGDDETPCRQRRASGVRSTPVGPATKSRLVTHNNDAELGSTFGSRGAQSEASALRSAQARGERAACSMRTLGFGSDCIIVSRRRSTESGTSPDHQGFRSYSSERELRCGERGVLDHRSIGMSASMARLSEQRSRSWTHHQRALRVGVRQSADEGMKRCLADFIRPKFSSVRAAGQRSHGVDAARWTRECLHQLVFLRHLENRTLSILRVAPTPEVTATEDSDHRAQNARADQRHQSNGRVHLEGRVGVSVSRTRRSGGRLRSVRRTFWHARWRRRLTST